MRRTALLALAALACAPSALSPRGATSAPDSKHSARIGLGYYLTKPPPDLVLPSNKQQKPVRPKVTSDFSGVPTSNDFWSSLMWQYDTNGKNPYSDPLYAHPLALKAEAGGLGLNYPTRPKVDRREYMFWYDKDLLVGLQDLEAYDTKVAAYSDWAVTAAWQTDAAELRATFGHGLPYVYFRRVKGTAAALVTPEKKPEKKLEVFHNADGWLGLGVGDRSYAVYGPTGAEWKENAGAFASDLAGKDFFSVAALPDRDPATLELFRKHAYAFVKDTRVSWKYDEASAVSEATFETVTELVEEAEGRDNAPLLALYRHQWKNTKDPLLAKSFASPRGEMKLFEGSRFTTRMAFNGVLPMLPNVADNDLGDLEFYVKQVYYQPELFPAGLGEKAQRDPYWVGKSLLKVGHAMEIADQVGYESARDHLLQGLKNELEDWFDGREPSFFYYDKTWRSLIGVPSGFGSSAELNDHHFHYGYFIYAAALVARHDPAWAKRWAPTIELLVRDPANWDRRDTRFPFLRHMDVYAGHSWANGPALFAEGNNEESSSEDVNFSAAAVLWGSAVGNRELRDLGIFLYTQQVQAIEQYWFDVDDAVFPKDFDHTTVAMVWGAGGRYDTWWDPNPIYVHGINMLPASGGALYLGRHPEYVKKNYAEVERRNRGNPLTWRDCMWMFLALSDPGRARRLFEDDPYFTPEFGNSTAMTYHWITNLETLGHPDITVTANAPTYAVFKKGNKRTHVAYNAGDKPIVVSFSDGAKLQVLPRKTAHDGPRWAP